ncbi:MAG: hypothetical protein HQL36_05195 [Alphaproteobacteria bacterium]|nr:hypothetical protein [Alphaproteobacteria bacterium]
MQISLVLDIVIAVLLVLTIAYAVRLNQRLSQLRGDKKELQDLAQTFAEATVRADENIKQLKLSAEALQMEVKRAEVLRDDLAYLVDRGGRTADEIVASVTSGEKAEQGDHKHLHLKSVTPPAPAAKPKRNISPSEAAEARLIEEAIRAATPGDGKANDNGRAGLLGALNAARADAGPKARKESDDGGAMDFSLPFHLDRDEDAGSLEDTAAARELMKALSAVK